MTFTDYISKARTFMQPQCENFPYLRLGLYGEIGEVCEKLKKYIRDDNGIVTDERREAIKGELGDVCWYVAMNLDWKHNETLNMTISNAKQKIKCRNEYLEELGRQMLESALVFDNRPRFEAACIIETVEVIANVFGLSLNDVCLANIDKLSSRQARGVINGNGDNR